MEDLQQLIAQANKEREERASSIMNKLLKVTAALYLWNSVTAYTTVALQKHVMHYSAERAAVVNYLTGNFLMFPALEGAHRAFYNDSNYKATARKELNMQ